MIKVTAYSIEVCISWEEHYIKVDLEGMQAWINHNFPSLWAFFAWGIVDTFTPTADPAELRFFPRGGSSAMALFGNANRARSSQVVTYCSSFPNESLMVNCIHLCFYVTLDDIFVYRGWLGAYQKPPERFDLLGGLEHVLCSFSFPYFGNIHPD